MGAELERVDWKRVTVHPTAEINVTGELAIGAGSVIGPGVVIEGTRVVIGREAWLDRGAYIGGGSAFDPGAFLVAGDWLHMGRNGHINTARGVTVGHEFGCGIETKVFTHGAYQSELDGFPVKFAPVTIGDRVWLPNAWVNPGVTIGSDVVVAARSLVNRDLPSGCLAGGIPAQVIKEGCYPSRGAGEQGSKGAEEQRRLEVLLRIIAEAEGIAGQPMVKMVTAGLIQLVGGETFNVVERTISGPATEYGRVLKNQLRRHGIRFRYEERDGMWQPWT